MWRLVMLFFFFQAEDSIRDHCVTGVQTCALPISADLVVHVQVGGSGSAAWGCCGISASCARAGMAMSVVRKMKATRRKLRGVAASSYRIGDWRASCHYATWLPGSAAESRSRIGVSPG